ncbi:MAG: efflux RND transporter periplasmic adaptor subunit [Spirochaetes bacterium]|nr:efflux RND transporter periplasmic adaptor subunit [Spirochaetota bacterium]
MAKKAKAYMSINNSKKGIPTKYVIIGIVLFIVILRIFISVVTQKKKVAEVDFVPVEASLVREDTIRDSIYLTERLQALSDVNVYAPVSGWVDRINVDIGSKVQKYQVVAQIDRNIVGSEFAKAIVKAPISGEVGSIYIDRGANVSPAVPLMSIVNYDMIKIYVNIPEKYIERVHKGDVALINVESQKDEEFIGKIEKISSAINALTGTFQAKISIPNRQKKLKPGSFANIKVVLDIKKATIIPKDALVETEGIRPYVFRVVKNRAMKTYVEKGIEEEENVEIIKGVSPGDIVITIGKDIVKPDSPVYIANARELGLVTEKTNKDIKKEAKKKAASDDKTKKIKNESKTKNQEPRTMNK